MSLTKPIEYRAATLARKGFAEAEIAHILNIDIGYVRSIVARADHPTLSPLSSRNYFGRRDKRDEE